MAQNQNENFKEVVVENVQIAGLAGEAIIILKEKGGSRTIPIWIGITEANSISLALQRISVPRPLTHDLFLIALGRLGARLNRVVITGVALGTFFAKIELATKDGSLELDARPSDAAALALRAGVPIFASEEVLQNQSGEQLAS